MEITQIDRMEILTPREIVAELDKYIVGQKRAKKAVAIAIRNRWRRMRVEGKMKEEIYPKNIIMIGPTGVGKTEIARRLAKLVDAPFVKVEATKYTEVGYVGRDVESMVRDLVNIAINQIKEQEKKKIISKAKANVEERLVDLLLKGKVSRRRRDRETEDIRLIDERHRIREMLKNGEMEDEVIELESKQQFFPVIEVVSGGGSFEELEGNLREMFSNIFPGRDKRRRITVKEAREVLIEEEVERLIDMQKVIKTAIKRTEESGIIFIDEMDKIAGRDERVGPNVSREGVQRDLIPIVEGTTVVTKYGPVRTDHILFIAAGAFHMSKPSDLIPELQGRFPIRVELDPLTEDDFVRILIEPENALTRQYIELLRTEGVKLSFKDEAIKEIARIAAEINSRTENIGARRLYTVMERLLEDVLFDAPEMKDMDVVITSEYVKERLERLLEDEDLTRYIL